MGQLRDIRNSARAAVAALAVCVLVLAARPTFILAPRPTPAEQDTQSESQTTVQVPEWRTLTTRALIIVTVVLVVVVPLLTPILFLRWFYLAYQNLQRAAIPALRYSARSTLSAFLIPGLNIVRPYLMMQELWLASKALATAGALTGDHWRAARHSRLVLIWWLSFLLAGGLLTLGEALSPDPASGAVFLKPVVESSTSLVFAVAGILAIAVVRAVTHVQLVTHPATHAQLGA